MWTSLWNLDKKRGNEGRETPSAKAVGHFSVRCTLQFRYQKGTEEGTMRIPNKIIQTFINGGEVPRLESIL
jgi:hypothetical protein